MADTIDKDAFAKTICKFLDDGRLNIIEALVEYCNTYEFDMNDIIPLLDRSMKERIRVAAIQNRYVLGQKINTLPI